MSVVALSITGDALRNFEPLAGVECFPSDNSYPLQFKYISFEAVANRQYQLNLHG